MKTRQRLAGGVALLTIVLGYGLTGAGRVPAQGLPAPPDGDSQAAKKHYTNNSTFKLPVQIEPAERARLQEVRLYVKHGAAEWKLQDTAVPSQQFFYYKAPDEGEYAFSLVTVDRAGRANPPDVRREPPMLVVTVDRQPPAVEVEVTTRPLGDRLVHCTVTDANPDYKALQASYQRPDKSWQPLEALPGAPGDFRVPGGEPMTGALRITATDMAKNTTTRELNLADLQGKQTASAGPDLPAQRGGPPLPAEKNPVPALPPAPMAARAPGAPEPLPHAAAPAAVERAAFSAPPGAPAGAERMSFTGPANPTAASRSPSRQLLNTTRAALDYRLDQVGPSGVSKVEVYVTTDEGKTWQRLCEDPDRRSPAEMTLPGEGLFGVRLVVTNGNGFGGTPPARGDAPTCWIEVDQTPPHVQLREVDPVVKEGALEVRWTATDKNLGPEPVALYYAAKREGPWVPIVRGLRNDGLYRWSFPRDVGGQFFLRLEVVDQAGNIARSEPSNPVVLDMTEPHASVVAVTGVSARP
jgi:hypothetical protein